MTGGESATGRTELVIGIVPASQLAPSMATTVRGMSSQPGQCSACLQLDPARMTTDQRRGPDTEHVPVVALMPTRPIAPVLITIYICIGTLQHANLRWTFGPAGRVLVSPAYHRLHHAPDTQRVNLGVVLTIWDILAGCARFPSRSDAVGRTGLNGRPVPVEQDDAAGLVLLLVGEQLIEPFQARS